MQRFNFRKWRHNVTFIKQIGCRTEVELLVPHFERPKLALALLEKKSHKPDYVELPTLKCNLIYNFSVSVRSNILASCQTTAAVLESWLESNLIRTLAFPPNIDVTGLEQDTVITLSS